MRFADAAAITGAWGNKLYCNKQNKMTTPIDQQFPIEFNEQFPPMGSSP